MDISRFTYNGPESLAREANLIRKGQSDLFSNTGDKVSRQDCFLRTFTRERPASATEAANSFRWKPEAYGDIIDVPATVIGLYAAIIESSLRASSNA